MGSDVLVHDWLDLLHWRQWHTIFSTVHSGRSPLQREPGSTKLQDYILNDTDPGIAKLFLK